MAYRRGDVIAVPYAYSDLLGGKVRPAVIVSSDAYSRARPDVVAAGITTQIASVGPYDHLLADWATAGLRYPSAVRGRLLTIEQTLIHRAVGRVSDKDWQAIEAKLISFLVSDQGIVSYLLSHVSLSSMSGAVVQELGEHAIQAGLTLADHNDPAIDLDQWRTLLSTRRDS